MTQQTTRHYPVVSLFCGLGGLDLGFTEEGFDVIWANDNAISAVKSYELNFDLRPVHRDIAQVPLEAIPDADVVIGGPPCQAFSLVGQRKSDDPRGRLVFTFLEIVKAKMPRAFVMENVPGMAASRIEGRRLPDILAESFREFGYHVEKMDLLATDYFVPQLRRRVVLVGCVDRHPRMISSEAFANHLGIDSGSFELSARAAIGDLGECTEKGKRARYRLVDPSPFAKLMRLAGLRDVSLHECPRMSETDRLLLQHIPPGGNYMDIPDEIATGRVLKFKQTGGRTTTYGRLHPDRAAYTINTYFRRPNVGHNFHYSEPRLITPREAMRFQSISDHIELDYTSQDDRNRLIGNAVPPLMAQAIALCVWNALEGVRSETLEAESLVQLPLI